MPASARRPSASRDLGGEFARVVRVDGDEERVMLFQHRAELGRDPLRQENRDARADADELDVRDGPQTGEDLVELVVREEQGIAAGKQDVADLGVLFEIFESRLPLGFQMLLADTGNDSRARAVAAVGGAAVGHEEQHPVRIAMDQSGHGHVGILAAGIGHFLGSVPAFLDARESPAGGSGNPDRRGR